MVNVAAQEVSLSQDDLLGICFWHKADIDFGADMSAFGGKADIPDRLADVR